MWSRAGASPVIGAARVGEQTGAAAYASVNLTPCSASRLIFGVTSFLLPWQFKSVHPRSSAMIRTMLGRSSAIPSLKPPYRKQKDNRGLNQLHLVGSRHWSRANLQGSNLASLTDKRSPTQRTGKTWPDAKGQAVL